MQSDNQWATAAGRLNKHVSQDNRLGRHLSDVSQHLANESKIAFRIEEGRVYGLLQQKYDMILKREISRQWKNPPVQNDW